MVKKFTSLGLMSGTSMDGIDASIIESDGNQKYQWKLDKYAKFNDVLRDKLLKLRDKILFPKDLKKFEKEILVLEKEITIRHADFINDILQEFNSTIDIVGFHGQTIYHSSKNKISKQIGDGKLLSQLIKNKVVYNFRENDIINGGEGAPLIPAFHKLITDFKKIQKPVCFLNIGGISNLTLVIEKNLDSIESKDLGPGNCLIDEWFRYNQKGQFDKDGNIASSGKINQLVLNQALDTYDNKYFNKKKSFDVKDFDINFLRGLSFEDGVSTITEFTSKIISDEILTLTKNFHRDNIEVILCGGGRKNKHLIRTITEKTKLNFCSIDKYNINGDFIESQGFAYLAIRSYLNLPITFPKTTGCIKPSTGGVLIE